MFTPAVAAARLHPPLSISLTPAPTPIPQQNETPAHPLEASALAPTAPACAQNKTPESAPAFPTARLISITRKVTTRKVSRLTHVSDWDKGIIPTPTLSTADTAAMKYLSPHVLTMETEPSPAVTEKSVFLSAVESAVETEQSPAATDKSEDVSVSAVEPEGDIKRFIKDALKKQSSAFTKLLEEQSKNHERQIKQLKQQLQNSFQQQIVQLSTLSSPIIPK